MNTKGVEYLEDVFDVHSANLPIKDRYPRLRTILEKACRNLTASEPVQFSDLFSRLNYVCQKTNYSRTNIYHINSLRIRANKILHEGLLPTEDIYKYDLRAICKALSHFYQIPIPSELVAVIPASDPPHSRPAYRRYDNLRVQFVSREGDVLTVYSDAHEEHLHVLVNVNGINDIFSSSIEQLWMGCTLNLLEVKIDDNNNIIPGIIVIEPDYLLNVTSIAENFKQYGSHPLNFVKTRFERIPNSTAILLGNYANEVLDHFLTKDQFDPTTYQDILKKVFRENAFKIATNTDLCDTAKKLKFFQDGEDQFEKIKQTVFVKFAEMNIRKDMAVLEPAFLCEKLGIQGRMDFLQLDKKILIELKSGKADEFKPVLSVTENHLIQTHLYLGILQFNTGTDHRSIQQNIFYSKYPKLINEQTNWSKLKNAINIRNLIIANEHNVCIDESAVSKIMGDINAETLNVKLKADKFWDVYLKPPIDEFRSILDAASPIEKKYFECLYAFIVRENYLANIQTSGLGEDTEQSYWTDFNTKRDAGEILYDCTIIADTLNLNSSEEASPPSVAFSIPQYPLDILPNFRRGDVVFVYQRNSARDNATTQQVFKGHVAEISSSQIKVQFRYRQNNPAVFPLSGKYAIEHDQIDSSYSIMFQGIFAFLKGDNQRRDLLLGLRQPFFNRARQLRSKPQNETIRKIVAQSVQADDYFLLVGPPGTGKTSQALMAMVMEFLLDPNSNVLILSYTNRAVDEICDNLMKINEQPEFIRISSESSCGEVYKPYLMGNVLRTCTNVDQLKNKVAKCRLYVGTVAAVGSQLELFKLKTFSVAIVDEASQILEPSLLSVLMAKTSSNTNAVDKFVLIGDHKQLPAVVLQSPDQSVIHDTDLKNIGMLDRRNSLFERLYILEQQRNEGANIGKLIHQGRMHEDIALFPNHAFYNSKLKLVPRPHQIGPLDFPKEVVNNSNLNRFIAKSRLAFIPSDRNANKNYKVNPSEAKITAGIIKAVYELYAHNFKPERTIGVITPYRSQIALIRRELESLKIPALEKITVDTVERYQGSERDVIVYSVCSNTYDQIDNLSTLILSDGQLIDRKLNVALTRARKQLFITGNTEILTSNLIYYKLIEFIRSRNGFINVSPQQFLNGDFDCSVPDINSKIATRTFEPEPKFEAVFNKLVLNPILDDGRTRQLGNGVLGRDSDFIRMRLIDYGRADFDQETLEFSAEDKVNLYCYFNMRKHYATGLAIFSAFNDFLTFRFTETQNRITFIDFGCGPLTSGLAFKSHFGRSENFQFNYIGIDVSGSMRSKARAFAESELFPDRDEITFVDALSSVSNEYLTSTFILSNTVLLNFSYLFGNLNGEQAMHLADQINHLIERYPLNKYVLIYQNSSQEKRNRSYNIFRKRLTKYLVDVSEPKIETVSYRTRAGRNYENTETVYYEVKST